MERRNNTKATFQSWICESKGIFGGQATGGAAHLTLVTGKYENAGQEVRLVGGFIQARLGPAASPGRFANEGWALETKGNLALNATSGGQPQVEEVCPRPLPPAWNKRFMRGCATDRSSSCCVFTPNTSSSLSWAQSGILDQRRPGTCPSDLPE